MYSELEKKNNGDVSRKASTVAIPRASAPILVKYIALVVCVLVMMPETGDPM